MFLLVIGELNFWPSRFYDICQTTHYLSLFIEISSDETFRVNQKHLPTNHIYTLYNFLLIKTFAMWRLHRITELLKINITDITHQPLFQLVIARSVCL